MTDISQVDGRPPPKAQGSATRQRLSQLGIHIGK